MSTLTLGVVGNCNISALIDPRGSHRLDVSASFDGDPIFNSLVMAMTRPRLFEIALEGSRAARNIIRPTRRARTPSRPMTARPSRIVDFCPRYKQFERYFAPRLSCAWSARCRNAARAGGLRPTFNSAVSSPSYARLEHARFVGPTENSAHDQRVISYILENAVPPRLDLFLVLAPDETLTASVENVSARL